MSSIRPHLFQNHSDLGSDFIQSDQPLNLSSRSSWDGVSKSEPVRIVGQSTDQLLRVKQILLESKLLESNHVQGWGGEGMAKVSRCPLPHPPASLEQTITRTKQRLPEPPTVVRIPFSISSILESNNSKEKRYRYTSVPINSSQNVIDVNKKRSLFKGIKSTERQSVESSVENTINEAAQTPLLKYEQCGMLQKEWDKICTKRTKKKTSLKSIEKLEEQKQKKAARNRLYQLRHKDELLLKKRRYRLEHKKELALKRRADYNRLKQKLQAAKISVLSLPESQVQ